MSADKFVSKMVSAEFYNRNFQETEGEKESKNEKTVQKCAVQQTPSQEVSETSSDVGSEGLFIIFLFSNFNDQYLISLFGCLHKRST